MIGSWNKLANPIGCYRDAPGWLHASLGDEERMVGATNRLAAML